MCAVSAARSASPHASTGTSSAAHAAATPASPSPPSPPSSSSNRNSIPSSARGKTQPSKHAPATSASAASGHGRYLVVDNHNNK